MSSHNTYYETIVKTPLLTKEEEFRLLTTLRSEESSSLDKRRARDHLIKANLRFVFKQAKKYSRKNPSSFDDLLSSGNEGLMVGIDKFDIDSGYRLLTYANFWIFQRIMKEMSRLRLVSLPIWKQQVAAKISKLKEETPEITFDQIKEQCPGIAEKDIKELSETAFLTCFIEDMADSEFKDIEFEVEEEIDNQRLHAHISNLSENHQKVIVLAMGFDDGKEKSVNEISKATGFTKDQVSTYKREALEVLRVGYRVEL